MKFRSRTSYNSPQNVNASSYRTAFPEDLAVRSLATLLVTRPIRVGTLRSRSLCATGIRKVDRMANLESAKIAWKKADAVTFDVDSTVIQEEGIDELAKFCGKGQQVADLTKQAMQGNVTFQQSLTTRLNIVKPSSTRIKRFLEAHPAKLTPGIKALVAALHSRGKKVFLVSGGFHCLIAPIAAQLDIPSENIYANKLKFYFTGEYAGFDESQPTARSGGKAEVIRRLKEDQGFQTVVHVGDGATDVETFPPADTFIGYGGNVIRESVKSRAPWFVTDFNELIEAL